LSIIGRGLNINLEGSKFSRPEKNPPRKSSKIFSLEIFRLYTVFKENQAGFTAGIKKWRIEFKSAFARILIDFVHTY